MVELGEEKIADKHTVFRYASSLKSSLYEESKNCSLLLPFVQDIQSALEVENYSKALHLIDELEEFMDLEFCKPRTG